MCSVHTCAIFLLCYHLAVWRSYQSYSIFPVEILSNDVHYVVLHNIATISPFSCRVCVSVLLYMSCIKIMLNDVHYAYCCTKLHLYQHGNIQHIWLQSIQKSKIYVVVEWHVIIVVLQSVEYRYVYICRNISKCVSRVWLNLCVLCCVEILMYKLASEANNTVQIVQW